MSSKTTNILLLFFLGLLLFGSVFTGIKLSSKKETDSRNAASYSSEVQETTTINNISKKSNEKYSGNVINIKDETVEQATIIINQANSETTAEAKENTTIVDKTTVAMTETKPIPTATQSTIPNEYRIGVGQSYIVSTSSFPDDTRLTFKSLDPNIASIDGNGIVKGKSVGHTIIIVRGVVNHKLISKSYNLEVY